MRLSLLFAAIIFLAACEQKPRGPYADLVVSPTGTYTLEDKPVAAENLVAELTALRARQPGVLVYVLTDANSNERRGVDQAYSAARAAGVDATNGVYREQERARKIKGFLFELLFWGGINLVAMLICAPRVLSSKTPADAFRGGFLGVWVVGVLISAAIGVVMDIKLHGGGVSTIGLTILALPFSFVAGLIAGSVFRIWVRVRLKRAAALP